MKKCIVLSGQYRTFDQTWQNIKQFIDINNLEVYCHLWSTNQQEIENVQQRLKPVRFLSEDYHVYIDKFDGIDERARLANPKGPNQDRLAGNASMNFGRSQAFSLIDYTKYDTVVYCRYDIGFSQLFQFDNIESVITPEAESYNLISDIFAIIPFKFAKSYFLYDRYEKLNSTPYDEKFLNYLRSLNYPEHDIKTHVDNRYCPHMLLMRSLLEDETPWHKTNLPVYLQR
jgi:hypothetical protein